MDIVDQLVEKRDEILAICARHGASNVRVFGSCARDDYDEKSDVDMLVKFNKQYYLGDLFVLQEELEKLLGRKVDLGTDKMLKTGIRKDVLDEAVPL